MGAACDKKCPSLFGFLLFRLHAAYLFQIAFTVLVELHETRCWALAHRCVRKPVSFVSLSSV